MKEDFEITSSGRRDFLKSVVLRHGRSRRSDDAV